MRVDLQRLILNVNLIRLRSVEEMSHREDAERVS